MTRQTASLFGTPWSLRKGQIARVVRVYKGKDYCELSVEGRKGYFLTRDLLIRDEK